MLSSSAIEGIVAEAWQPGGKPSPVVVSGTAYHYGACHSGNIAKLTYRTQGEGRGSQGEMVTKWHVHQLTHSKCVWFSNCLAITWNLGDGTVVPQGWEGHHWQVITEGSS